MNLEGKKVLVTGSDGFIGSHLVEALLAEGCQVKAFVYYNSFNSWGWLDTFPKEKLDKIEVFAGDVRDPNGIRQAIKGVDIVFHLAALSFNLIPSFTIPMGSIISTPKTAI